MTEDGRSTGMAALCGRSLNLLRGWGHQDAQLDANANSLWLRSATLGANHPNDKDLSLGTPGLRQGWGTRTLFGLANPGLKGETWGTHIVSQSENFAFLEEISHENVPGK
jgi:hypothetical protein